jgi:dihydrodipicolinate synthase/N-acetylneuraminate lyase
MPEFEVNGIIPIVPTPFTKEGDLDLEALRGLLEFAVAARVCAVCLPAYASEFYKLVEGERRELVYRAIAVLDGRLPLVAQVNHVSPAAVVEVAREFERVGASAISVAVPRIFGLPERDLLRYFDSILEAITIPLIIQDFNPGGASLSAQFARTLHSQHNHFRYLKLEEPMMAAKVRSVIEETGGAVGVIDGWGGSYMLELIDAGICGVMPGLGVSDLLQIVWESAREGKKDAAYEVFQAVLPQITYSLQSMEFFHHAEKALLRARGLLSSTVVRDATLTVSEIDRSHIDFLNRRIVDFARQEDLRRQRQDNSDGRRGARPAQHHGSAEPSREEQK